MLSSCQDKNTPDVSVDEEHAPEANIASLVSVQLFQRQIWEQGGAWQSLMWGSIVFYLTFVCGILVTYQEEGVNTDKLVCNHSKGSAAQEPIVGVSKLGLGIIKMWSWSEFFFSCIIKWWLIFAVNEWKDIPQTYRPIWGEYLPSKKAVAMTNHHPGHWYKPE